LLMKQKKPVLSTFSLLTSMISTEFPTESSTLMNIRDVYSPG
jgi:hypothetical protein